MISMIDAILQTAIILFFILVFGWVGVISSMASVILESILPSVLGIIIIIVLVRGLVDFAYPSYRVVT